MSYPNDHVVPKTLSSCSVPRYPAEPRGYVVRRSRGTGVRVAHASPSRPHRAVPCRSHCCIKVEQSRAITTSWPP